MKLTKLTLCLATLALGIASAASSYTITIPSAITAGDTQLKAGQYKLQVEGNQAIFKQGKTSITVPVTVEKSANKFRFTSVETDQSKLQAIDLGGTNMKLMVGSGKTEGSQPAGQ